MVSAAASMEVVDEVKGGKEKPKEEQNSSVTKEAGYNLGSPLNDGKYYLARCGVSVTIQIGDMFHQFMLLGSFLD